MARVSDTLKTPLGTLTLEASEHGLTAIQFPRAPKPPIQDDESNPILDRAKIELEAYFRGNLTQFTVPLHWQGTPFQQAVWEALTRIPFGETVSYRDIAKLIDRPRAARPVGGGCWTKSATDYRAVPSRHRQRSIADRFYGRAVDQRTTAQARRGTPHNLITR